MLHENNDNPLSSLPESWQLEVRRLRRECAKFRHELRESEAAVAALQEVLAVAVRSR